MSRYILPRKHRKTQRNFCILVALCLCGVATWMAYNRTSPHLLTVAISVILAAALGCGLLAVRMNRDH